MRIPIPVVIIIGLLTGAGLWWLRTRNMDFMTPKGAIQPLPEFMTQPVAADLAPSQRIATEVPRTNPTPFPDTPAQPELEYGDLESSPGLAEYSEHANKGAGYLIRLATELEVQGQWERALLAWERVIDSCQPSPLERTTAEDAIVRIRPTLTHWNIDPEGDVQIWMQLGTSRRKTENLKEAAREAAEILRRDSDHTLLITPRITTARVANAPEDAPIAIYFSGVGKNDNPNMRALNPEGDEVGTYERLLLSHSYQLVRQEVGNLGGLMPPQAAAHPDNPEMDFQRQITRLHWKRFGESLSRPAPDGQN